MTGRIFDIQKGCVDDGPGIRTTVFFKGCPLNCIWCHNPESKDFGIHTYADGTKTVGRDVCMEEIMQSVLADRAYYTASGGGVTLSGGEPLAQPDFVCRLLVALRQHGIHTCVETCGFVKKEVLDRVLPLTDLFLYDIKALPEIHKRLTGVDSELILSNLDYLYQHRAEIIVRCPIIPTINDTEEHFDFLHELKRKYPHLGGMQIMPYHNLGNSKAERMGLEILLELGNPTQEQIAMWRERLEKVSEEIPGM